VSVISNILETDAEYVFYGKTCIHLPLKTSQYYYESCQSMFWLIEKLSWLFVKERFSSRHNLLCYRWHVNVNFTFDMFEMNILSIWKFGVNWFPFLFVYDMRDLGTFNPGKRWMKNKHGKWVNSSRHIGGIVSISLRIKKRVIWENFYLEQRLTEVKWCTIRI